MAAKARHAEALASWDAAFATAKDGHGCSVTLRAAGDAVIKVPKIDAMVRDVC
jgi:hypothetical protein